MTTSDKNIFTVVAEINKIESRAKGWRIVFDTNELGPQDSQVIMASRDQQGWLLWKPGEAQIKADEMKDLPELVLEDGEKKPSSRLRAVLFRVWEQSDRTLTSDQFYKDSMEKIIEHYKKKLT